MTESNHALSQEREVKKILYLLPNAFTVASICCGLYALIIVAQFDGDLNVFYKAAMAICFSALFDMFDGRVARMTGTESEFGVQMDSLADAVSFGVAPCFLIYNWALHQADVIGLLASFYFAICAIARLARFNVLASRGYASPLYFEGLPTPSGAGAIVLLVILHVRSIEALPTYHIPILFYVVLMATLMVTPVRFPTFKKTKINELEKGPLLLGTALFFGLWIYVRLSAAFWGLLMLYISVSIIQDIPRLFKKEVEE